MYLSCDELGSEERGSVAILFEVFGEQRLSFAALFELLGGYGRRRDVGWQRGIESEKERVVLGPGLELAILRAPDGREWFRRRRGDGHALLDVPQAVRAIGALTSEVIVEHSRDGLLLKRFVALKLDRAHSGNAPCR